MRVRRLAGIIAGAVLGIVVFGALTVTTIVMTELGSRWAIVVLFKPFARQISIASISGRLWDRLVLDSVRMQTEPVSGSIEQVRFEWQLAALLSGQLIVDSVVFDGADLIINAPPSDPNAAPLRTLPAPPLPVTLQRLDFHRLNVDLGQRTLVVDKFGFSAIWDAEQIVLREFDLNAYGHTFSLNAAASIGSESKLDASAAWSGELAEQTAQGSLKVTGPLSELKFESLIDAQVSASVSGTVDAFADIPKFSLTSAIAPTDFANGIHIESTTIGLAGTFDSLHTTIATQLDTPGTDPYALSLTANVANLAAKDDSISAEIEWQAVPQNSSGRTLSGTGHFRFEGDTIYIKHSSRSPYASRLDGHIDIANQALELELNWHDIHHGLADGRLLDSHSGTVQASGAFDALQVALQTAMSVSDLGPVGIDARGQLAQQSFKLDTFEAVLLGGTVESKGNFAFATKPSCALSFSGKTLDLSAIHPATPSRINFAGSATCENSSAGFLSRVVLDDMSGFVRGQALSGAAIVETKPGRITVEHARISTGPNKLEIEGTWGQEIDGRFVIDLPDISLLESGADGRLAGSGTLSGSLELPKIKAEITGTSVRLNDVSLGSLNVEIDVDLARSAPSHAELAISDLIYQREKLDALNIELRGTAQNHTIHFDLDSPELSADGSAFGALASGAWNGLINSFEFNSRKFGQWSLRDPSEITLSRDASSLANACLEAKEGLACITADRSAAKGNAKISLLGLPVALANYYLPTTLTLGGSTDGVIDVHLVDGKTTGEGTLKIRDGVLNRDNGSGEVDTVPIDAFALDFEILTDVLHATASAVVGQWFSLTAGADWERAEDGKLSILVDANASDISWFEDFVPELSGSHGALELHAKVSGNLATPRVDTKLKLSSGALVLPDIGLNIDSLAVQVNGETSEVDVDATIGSADHQLNLTGLASRVGDGDFRYDLTLRGDTFPAIRTLEVEADISPDLRLLGDRTSLDVTGTLNLPKVLVDIEKLPNSAVRVSSDQILVTADGTLNNAQPKSNFVTDALSGNVDVVLGDSISINGFGLTSKLSGDLKWTKKRASAQGRANGAIRIDEGVFKAYGQHMEIETGRIQFVGPIDNPRIAVQAIRPDLPVKAGVNVSGTILQPKISLFSQPVLSDGNILSYIVTGHGLEGAAASDAGLLTQAALSLGAEESAAATNQIRNAFGIDELSVASGETARDTSLIAGKRLSPKLTVRTGFNPFDQLWSFFLNYKLTDHWSIESESGNRQGADILYTFEREKLFNGSLFE